MDVDHIVSVIKQVIAVGGATLGGISLLCTFLSGLSNYPRIKTWGGDILLIINRLGWAHFVDSPGTFKVFGKRSPNPHALQDQADARPRSGGTVLVFLAIALAGVSACVTGQGQSQARAVGAVALACALEPVAEHASQLANTVTAALLQPSAAQQLDGLAVTMTADAVLCAVKAALAGWAGAHGQLSGEAQEAIKRGNAYLAAHHVAQLEPGEETQRWAMRPTWTLIPERP